MKKETALEVLVTDLINDMAEIAFNCKCTKTKDLLFEILDTSAIELYAIKTAFDKDKQAK